MDTVNPALPEILEMSDGADKEIILMTSKFVTEQADAALVGKLLILKTRKDFCTHTGRMKSWSGRTETPKRWCRTEGATMSLRARVLKIGDYPVLTGHLGERPFYDVLPCKYCWPRMVKNAGSTVADCQSCQTYARRTSHRKQLRFLQPLDRSNTWQWRLQLITKNEIRHSTRIILTEWNTKLIKAISVTTGPEWQPFSSKIGSSHTVCHRTYWPLKDGKSSRRSLPPWLNA